MRERRIIRVRGTVQGVGFRPWVYRWAEDLGLAGSVRNDRSGVLIDAEGPADALDALLVALRTSLPPLAKVTTIETGSASPLDRREFKICDSDRGQGPAVAVPPDVAVCDACLAEMRDPADRRHRYPFVNCTACGPRYTIIRSLPYDRASTTMAPFARCPDCDREYHDPGDRRFHAEPVACPHCGPHVAYRSATGDVLSQREAALDQAIAALRDGMILAVKGIGGYHLAADAGNAAAVTELRRRKRRDDKPFAVMVGDRHQARALVTMDPSAEAALVSVRRPIVLAPRRRDGPIAAAVAPALVELGVMLPYSPLHHLLADGVGAPLVMTSGNRSDEPTAHEDDDAVARLGPLVDAFLTHDRSIHVRCDDSVVRSTPAGPIMIRRSRGCAPELHRLVVEGPPLLAVGAHLKSTVAVAAAGAVVASHHIGDLDHPGARRSFLQAITHLCHLTGIDPLLVAHDLHPDYPSTAHALTLDLPAEPVQHHHAHIASCLVEHGSSETVIGVAFDGLGLGTDGGLWGGELLVADLCSAERIGHLRPAPLPGGDRAAREPWRMALSWVDAALGEARAAALGPELDERWEAVHALARRPGTPTTTSAGRLFDAVAALAGLRAVSSYEGQAAMELEAASWGGTLLSGEGGVEVVERDGSLVLDPAPLLARLMAGRAGGAPAADMAATFHDELAAGVVAAAARAAGVRSIGTVALSGGVFQNARLTTAVTSGLDRLGLRVLCHRTIPANDGGISIGQAAVASARHAVA